MTHYQTALRDPLVIDHEVANLTVHLSNRRRSGLWVVISLEGVRAGEIRTLILEIRQIEVDDAFELPYDTGVVVAAAVVDQRDAETALDGVNQGADDVRYDVGRSHQIDVVAAAALEAEHGGCEVAMRKVSAITTVVDLPVLTEDAE
jgi:hypothetical protein